jgi:hypothetical protein
MPSEADVSARAKPKWFPEELHIPSIAPSRKYLFPII